MDLQHSESKLLPKHHLNIVDYMCLCLQHSMLNPLLNFSISGNLLQSRRNLKLSPLVGNVHLLLSRNRSAFNIVELLGMDSHSYYFPLNAKNRNEDKQL